MSNLPETMKAVEISEPGGPEVLKSIECPVPEAGPGQVLVKVNAAGVNRPDVMQRAGLYPPPPDASPLPGLEIAGEVVATGNGTTRFAVGDAVCALTAGGGYAEYCVAEETSCLPVPKGLSMLEAAALPETFFTVWHNVFQRGDLKSGEWLLVHGGSSGIGTTAIQLGVAFGAKVLVTVGNPDKAKACVDLGATRAINYRDEDFVDVVKEETGGHGADVILDMVGGDYIPRNYKAAAMDGRVVQIAFMRGPKLEANYLQLMLKRLTHTGSTLRPQSREMKGAIAQALEEKAWPLIEAGKVKPVIACSFPPEAAAEAHSCMEASQHIGKIMLQVSEA